MTRVSILIRCGPPLARPRGTERDRGATRSLADRPRSPATRCAMTRLAKMMTWVLVLPYMEALRRQPHWLGLDPGWCRQPPPPRTRIPTVITRYDDGWISLVEDRVECDEPKLNWYGIRCRDGQQRTYLFPVGVFELSQQVWLQPRTVIEGAADPNVAGNARQRPDLLSQTLFIASSRGCDGNITATKMPWPIPLVDFDGQQVSVKCVRKGFLMNDDTTLRNLNGQGLAEEGAGFSVPHEPNAYAGLNGGAFVELPGCVCTFASNGTCGRLFNASWHGEGGDHGPHFVTGHGTGVSNVLVENVRLNDILDVNLDPHASGNVRASLVGFWSAMTPSGEPHQNVALRRVVAMRTVRDGINVHGNVVNWTGSDLHFENTGDDVFAVWGAGGGNVDQLGFDAPYTKCGLTNTPATDVSFTRVFAKGISDWSSCGHIFGSGRVVYDQMACCDMNDYPAMSIDSTFCPAYAHANVTLDNLQWFDGSGKDRCDSTKDALGVGGKLTSGLECTRSKTICGYSNCHSGGLKSDGHE